MRTTVYKETTDDWYPSYKCHNMLLVRVSLTQTGPTPPVDGEWRVCVWGADDCGMEKDFDDITVAAQCFLDVISLEFVNMKDLTDMGFVSA
jgi:hypothetical protein